MSAASRASGDRHPSIYEVVDWHDPFLVVPTENHPDVCPHDIAIDVFDVPRPGAILKYSP